MNDLMEMAIPVNLPPELWHVLAAICATTIVIVTIVARVRIRHYSFCRMCDRNHESRPPQMNSYDFWWLHCRQGAAS